MNHPPPIPGAAPRGRLRALFSRSADPRWCVFVNLLAFPGLGTILARRRGGWAQAVIMVAGFILAVLFMLEFLREQLRQLASSRPSESINTDGFLWMGWWGFGLCALAWVWAAASSWSIWKSLPPAVNVRRTPP